MSKSSDPLVILGPVVFSHVYTFLPVRDLARAECVCASWLALSKKDPLLWHAKCLESKVKQVDLIPGRHWDIPIYQSELRQCDWRASCEPLFSVTVV